MLGNGTHSVYVRVRSPRDEKGTLHFTSAPRVELPLIVMSPSQIYGKFHADVKATAY